MASALHLEPIHSARPKWPNQHEYAVSKPFLHAALLLVLVPSHLWIETM